MEKVVYRYLSDDIFNIKKDRYNPYQTGNGVIISKVDKSRKRNGKAAQKVKNELRQYCY